MLAIGILNMIKAVEKKINSMNAKTLTSVRESIDNIEATVGTIIADQLRSKFWKQARALELI